MLKNTLIALIFVFVFVGIVRAETPQYFTLDVTGKILIVKIFQEPEHVNETENFNVWYNDCSGAYQTDTGNEIGQEIVVILNNSLDWETVFPEGLPYDFGDGNPENRQILRDYYGADNSQGLYCNYIPLTIQ